MKSETWAAQSAVETEKRDPPRSHQTRILLTASRTWPHLHFLSPAASIIVKSFRRSIREHNLEGLAVQAVKRTGCVRKSSVEL
jgi:hypothetical protein